MSTSFVQIAPDIAPPESDLKTAEAPGRRVALVTQQWVRGREQVVA